ncbi:MAG: substrate-binding domain-containing protein, partial [Propionibacteriales bacterium]|nr:substrate-binding domain-containing protein [Propionibacteriales bacterium]
MSQMSRIIALAAAGALAVTMSACSAGGTGGAGAACNVGITMPTRTLERWINDGEQLQKQLKDAGCTVDLQYADNKVDQQISQLQNQIAGGAKILVIASIDGTALGPVLDQAGKQGVKVIAYDRLINGNANVDYYATFDNYKVGQLQGNFLKDQLKLDSAKGPINFEPFAGSPDDNNAKFFFSGAWDV